MVVEYLAHQGQLIMGAELLMGTPECQTKLSPKYSGMGYLKKHGFHGNPLNDSREWG